MKTKTVASQRELDAVQSNETIWLDIKFGVPGAPAVLTRNVKATIRLKPGCCLSAFGENTIHATGSTVLAHDRCTVLARGASVCAEDNALVVAHRAHVVLKGKATADLWGESQCIATDEASVDAHDDATVDARDASCVNLWDRSYAVVKSFAVDIEMEPGMPADSIVYDVDETNEGDAVA